MSPPSPAAPPATPPDHIAAVAQHVSSACVITTELDGERFGLSATAFGFRLGVVLEQSSHSVIFGDVAATRHIVGGDTLLYGGRRFRQLCKVFSGMADGPDRYL